MKGWASRFFDKILIDADSGCWLWQGALVSVTGGYGQFKLNGKAVLVHRLSYQTFFGPIPKGKELDHRCRRNCAAPHHLQPVTHLVNIRRGASASRNKTHCPQGHPYSKENTLLYIKQTGTPNRLCRICSRARTRAYREGKRAA